MYGKVGDDFFPADGVVERRLQEVEQGNSAGESLQDTAKSMESVVDAGGSVMNSDGTFKLKRAVHRIPLLSDLEGLRKRIRSLGITYIVAFQKPSTPRLSIAKPDI